MDEKNKVVVHYADGRIVKGSTQDFHPDRGTFRVVLPNDVETLRVDMDELKAVFFVKQLEHSTPHPRAKEFSAEDSNRGNGRPVAVRFKDGELLVGYAHSYSAERPGFFVLPVDSGDNNLRAFVVRTSTLAVKLGTAAEEMVQAAKDEEKPKAA